MSQYGYKENFGKVEVPSTAEVAGNYAEKTVSYSLNLPTASWVGSASPYSQVVTITGSTTNSKIDIQADSTVLAQMISDGTNSLYIANNDNSGTLTAYAVGEKPSVNLTVQVTRTELA